MHEWLFARRGEFTDEELRQFVSELKLAPEPVVAAMASRETLECIQADAAAADAAGLKFTPMVFINGRPIQLGQ